MTARRLRLALVTDGLTPYVIGGIQRYSRMLAETLAGMGVALTVFHTATIPESVLPAEKLEGVDHDVWAHIHTEFVPYPRRARHPGHYVTDSWQLSRALLARFQNVPCMPDVIYAQGFTGLAFVEARSHGVDLPPIAVNLHGLEMFQRPSGFRHRLEQLLLRIPARSLMRRADLVVCYPGAIHRLVSDVFRVPEERVIVSPNAVDAGWLTTSRLASHSPRRLVFVGRDERRKGVHELTAAIRSLPVGSARFDFVGPIPDALRLLRSDVTYHGTIRDTDALQQILDASDALISPSYSEGMPTVILEAMARGLMVIATDVGSNAELVDGANGIILPRPTPPVIASAIKEVSAMSEESLLMRKYASLDRVQSFLWPKVAATLIADFRRALNSANASL